MTDSCKPLLIHNGPEGSFSGPITDIECSLFFFIGSNFIPNDMEGPIKPIYNQ